MTHKSVVHRPGTQPLCLRDGDFSGVSGLPSELHDLQRGDQQEDRPGRGPPRKRRTRPWPRVGSVDGQVGGEIVT